MNSHRRLFSWLALISIFLAFAGISFAQAPETVFTPEVQNVVLQFITNLALTHPIVATILTVMGTMRAWAKPICSLVHTIVEATSSKADDAALGSLQTFLTTTLVGRVLAYALDWLASIKVIPPAPKQP